MLNMAWAITENGEIKTYYLIFFTLPADVTRNNPESHYSGLEFNLKYFN